MRYEEFAPQFVIVMGGAGSGKNYWISKNPQFKDYVLVDVDEIKQRMPLSSAIPQIKIDLEDNFRNRENVVHPTTGGNLLGQQNKIKLARAYGYQVTLVLIDTPLETAVKRVAQRAASGGHDVKPEAIEQSNEAARSNFSALAKLVDRSQVVQ